MKDYLTTKPIDIDLIETCKHVIESYFTEEEILAELEHLDEGLYDYRSLHEGSWHPLYTQDRIAGASLHAAIPSSFEHDYHSSGTASLVGQQVNNAAELGAVAMMYRHPKFETFHAIYTRGTSIVGHYALSNRLPGSVAVVKNKSEMDNFIVHLNNTATHLGATGVYVVHNHPSGDSTPSTPDIKFTQMLATNVHGFKGHVVINHTFHSIDPSGSVQHHDNLQHEYEKTDQLAPHDVIGTKIQSPLDFAIAAKQFHKTDNAVLVGLGAKNAIVSMATFPYHLLQAGSRFHTLRSLARTKRFLQHTTAINAGVVVVPEKTMIPSMIHHVNNNVLGDVITFDGSSAHQLGLVDYTKFSHLKLPTFGQPKKIFNIL